MSALSNDSVVIRPMARRRASSVLICLVALALLSIIGACVVGSVTLSFADLVVGLRGLVTGAPDSLASTLLDLRLNRALTAFVIGGTLALAGVMMQALLRNPLADPYVLGVSGGAARLEAHRVSRPCAGRPVARRAVHRDGRAGRIAGPCPRRQGIEATSSSS